MPQVVAAAGFLFGGGAGFGAVTSIFGLQAGTIGFAALRIGASLLINTAISGFLAPKQSGISQAVAELSFPTSRPPYRFVYGNFRTNVTPLPFPIVGEYAYGVWLVQSRPSIGDMTIFINNQEVTLTGDPYDFDGDGATATDDLFAGHVNVFIGRGDQTSPPQVFLDEAGYDAGEDDADLRFKETDAGTGLTVLYIKMKAGSSAKRSERWGGGIPRVSVRGEMTPVYDPRESSQSLDDPSTWGYTDNQALIALDALTQNPFRPYKLRHINLESWREAADVADEQVVVKGGGTIPRYRAAGVLTFGGGEIEDLIEPIVRAGAGQLTRVGGVLGMTGGKWYPPTHTIRESLADMQFSTDSAQGDAPTEIRAEYSPESRPLESAETPIYVIPGALAANGGEPSVVSYDLGWVPDHRQAQRVARILGLRARETTTLTLVGVPADLELAAGSNTNVALQEPFGTYMNGEYRVEGIGAGLDPLGQSGVALRSSLSLRSTGSHIYAWNAATDEKDVYDPTFDAAIGGVPDIGTISITTGNTVNDTTGEVVIPRALFEFDPSTSAAVSFYEVQYARVSDDYSVSVTIDGDTRNASDNVFGYIAGEAGVAYKLRARAVTLDAASGWNEVTGIVMSVGVTLTAPTPVSATGGTNEIDVVFTASTDTDLDRTEIWAGDTSLVGDDSLIHVSYAPRGGTIEFTENGLGSAQTRYYFGRSRGSFDSASSYSAHISATTL